MLNNELFLTGYLAADAKDWSTEKRTVAGITIYVHDGDNAYPIDLVAFNKEAQLLIKQAKKGHMLVVRASQKNQKDAQGNWHNDLIALGHHWINRANYKSNKTNKAENKAKQDAQSSDAETPDVMPFSQDEIAQAGVEAQATDEVVSELD